MALPKTVGSNPETITITKDIWTLIANDVNAAKITSKFQKTQLVWITYIKVGSDEPVDLNIPKWKMPSNDLEFEDSLTARDLYLYAVDKDAKITIEV
ncbi:MAG: hypothetical protein ACTSRG_13050 [Candidatus Helarchaeota archaeon]